MTLQPISYDNTNHDFFVRLHKAKAYVQEHFEDLKKLSVGVHKLDNEICDGSFINIMEYENKDNPPWESHLKFVDLQILFEGSEDFIIANTSSLTPKEYDEKTDYHNWEGEGSVRLTLTPGNMLILLPYDAHRVGLPSNCGKTFVRKGIIKIPY